MSIVLWIITGVIAGWLAGMLVRGSALGVVGDIVGGVLGGLLGGFLSATVGIPSTDWFGAVSVAVIGGTALVWILHLIRPSAVA